ncbi:hypothetical protein APHCRT_0968 [Anaplasma phagocytophilum str. CRT53-1]|uniref:Uncharacterized protein n=1 Tax=Anaplasma phagocytophilum str. CRT53-1 TaxID=1359157 RepID=A0A0F3Q0C9_ANAPH|nr:hypothetical protein APHCRT_0968 [Anaplasma phagocytophilum str. CRT53-1]
MAENIRRVLCFKIVFSKLSSSGLRSNGRFFIKVLTFSSGLLCDQSYKRA